MKFLTDFGDSAVLMPLSVVVFAWLLTMRPRRPALWWLMALGFLALVITASKIVLFACPLADDINSPSGHTGFSLLTYGALAVIVAAELPRMWLRVATLSAMVLLVVGIGLSRVALHMHTLAEAGIGFGIGTAALAIFCFGYFPKPRTRRTVAPLLVGAAVILAAFHGGRINPEDNLHMLALELNVRALLCP